MKKIILTFLVIFCTFGLLFANIIDDKANLLTEDELINLEVGLEVLSEKWQTEFVIVFDNLEEGKSTLEANEKYVNSIDSLFMRNFCLYFNTNSGAINYITSLNEVYETDQNVFYSLFEEILDSGISIDELVLELVDSFFYKAGVQLPKESNVDRVENTEKVYDMASLLTAEQKDLLTQKINEFIALNHVDLILVSTDDNKGLRAQEYADDFYDHNNFGIGGQKNGILFLIDMDDRKYATSTTGTMVDFINDSILDRVDENVIPLMSSGDFYGAYDRFIFEMGRAFEPTLVDPNEGSKGINYFKSALKCFLIGLIPSLIVLLVLRSKLKTVKKKTQANDYYVDNSLVFEEQTDTFRYQTETRRKIERSSSSSSGSHGSSSGVRHGGRSGSF